MGSLSKVENILNSVRDISGHTPSYPSLHQDLMRGIFKLRHRHRHHVLYSITFFIIIAHICMEGRINSKKAPLIR